MNHMKKAALILAALAAVLLPSTAFATPYGDGSLTVSDSTPVAGAQVTVSGTGFAPNSSVEIVLQPSGQSLATTTADAAGAVSVVVTIPTGVLGNVTLEAVGTDAAGGAVVRSAGLTVVESDLPATGSSNMPILVAALIAAAAGGALVVIARLRHRAHA